MKEMKTKQQEKEKDVITVLPDNKRLAELLLKVEEEITGIEKKLKNNVKKKVVCVDAREFQLVHNWHVACCRQAQG